jgi:YtkA-like
MVEVDMSHPGMSPVFAEATETAPGSYRANIDFSMGGDWVVLLHIKLADGRKIERQVDVRGVRSN